MYISSKIKILNLVFLATCFFSFEKIYGQVIANFNANNINGCAPLVVQFNDVSSGNPTAWQWNFGNSVSSTQQNPTTVFTNPGTYTITLTASNSTSTNTKTSVAYITVNASPNVLFTASDSGNVCSPKTIQFTNQSTGISNPSYLWNFGDGGTSTLANPSHTYTNPGNYSVTLLISNSNGCSKSLTKQNFINLINKPNSVINASNTSACTAPFSTIFTASSNQTGVSYLWNFGDNTTGLGNTLTHTYNAIGTYTIQLISINTTGCKDTLIMPNYINISNLIPSFSVGNTLCQNTSVNFTNTSTPNGGNCLWNFGDGGTATINNPSHIYSNPGNYTVKLIVQSGSCIDSTTQVINIKPSPTASFTANPTVPCAAPGIVNFTSTSSGTGIISYFWNFGDITTSTNANPTHTYANYNQYTVQLTVTNNFGCSSTVIQNNLINIQAPLDTINLSNTHLCAPYTTSFSLNTNVSSAVVAYNWSFGNGQNSTAANPSTTYTNPGTYTISLSYTLANGCSYTKQKTIVIITTPTASFTASPSTICVGNSVSFTNTSSVATTYTWYFGDGNFSNSINNITHTYVDTGYFTVTLLASNGDCVDTAKQINVVYVNPPKALFTFTLNSCSDRKTIAFTNNSIGATSYLWNFGDGGTSTLTNPIHTYASNGTYQVILKAMNSITGCIHYDTLSVDIFNLNAQFNGTINACKQVICNYSANTNPNYSNYTWYWGDGTYSSNSNNSNYHAYANTGIYSIKLVVTDKYNCKDSIIKTNYVSIYGTNVNFVANTLQGCAPLNVLFNNTSSAALGASFINYKWDFGNGVISNSSNGNTIYNNAGSYAVQLIVTESHNCVDSITKLNYIQVNKPIAKFGVNKVIACNQELIYFSDSSISNGTGLTYNWSFGDGSSASSANPTHAYLQNGLYTVKLKITDNLGCTDSIIKTNFIQINGVKSSFIASDTLASCPPLVVNLTNTSINSTSSLWSFGNNGISTLLNPSIIYTNPGTYTIKLISTNAIGCIDSAFKTIIVNGPTGTFSYTPTQACLPNASVVFTATTNNTQSLLWDFSNGVTATTSGNTTSYTYTYNQIGNYVPKLVMTSGANCIIALIGTDTIRVTKTTAKFGASQLTFCKSGTVIFSDSSSASSGPIANFLWNFGDGTTSNLQNPSHTFTSPGVYTVRLIVLSTVGCADTAYKTITVLQGNNLNFNSNLFLCQGQGKYVSISSNAISINWFPTTGLSCSNCSNPFVNPTSSTNYTIIAVNNNGCIDTAQLLVTVQAKLPDSVDTNKQLCMGDSIQLHAYGGTSYTWSPINFLSNSQISNPWAYPTSNTTYSVAIHQGACTFDTLQITITVNPKPTLIAGTSQTITAGKAVQLSAIGTNINFYSWSPGATLSCATCANPTANPTENTTYYITVSNLFGCKSNDSVIIKIRCEDSQVFLPNTFTPNGDGINDVLAVRGVGISNILSFRIYNRWGQLIFEKYNFAANDYTKGWDGTYLDTPIGNDIFIYTVDAVCITGELLQIKGDVALIK
jgi:gliding motility-associated-like protein